MVAFHAKTRRSRILRAAVGKRAAASVRARGAIPAVMYGSDTLGVHDTRLMQLRRGFANLALPDPKFRSTRLGLLIHKHQHLDLAYAAHRLPLLAWAKVVRGKLIPVRT